MVEDEEIRYWQMVSCVCLGLVSRGGVEEVTALLELLYVYSSQGQELDGQGAPIKAEWATSHDLMSCWIFFGTND